MAAQTEHGRIITAAARAALKPIGCTQIGRSRTWISDERYWVIVIEFQPSGWGRGTYLNVGASWLWSYCFGKGLPFHWGYRVDDFVEFVSVDQFAQVADKYADRAACEVLALRKKFSSIASIAAQLRADQPTDSNRLFEAAVATGLAGDIDAARSLFETFKSLKTYNWPGELEQRARAADLYVLLEDASAFTADVVKSMQRRRALNGLALDSQMTDAMAHYEQ